MKTVAIVGVGLIGGSFGLALKRAGFAGSILGVSSKKTISNALQHWAIDEGVTIEDAAARADLVYLAGPISGILETLPKLAGKLKPGAVVTDAGSTKQTILEQAARSLPGTVFVGGHPMAGKESRGVEHADGGLFEGRPYLLCGGDDVRAQAGEFEGWLERIGARVAWMSAAEHDRLVAAASHGPQLLSTALAAALSRRTDAGAVATSAGPGLRDMTRLALSSYDIWRDILATNGGEIAAVLAEVEAQLAALRSELTSKSGEETSRKAFGEGASFAVQVRKG